MDERTPTLDGYELPAEIEAARQIARELETVVAFDARLQALDRLEQQLTELPGRLQYLNARGVTYDLALGQSIGLLVQRLNAASEAARALADRETRQLRPRIEQLWAQIRAIEEPDGEVEGARAGHIAGVLESAESLRTRVEHGNDDIAGIFYAIGSELDDLSARTAHLEAVAALLKGARWTPAPGELVRDGDPADYWHKGKETWHGYLFLTTRRLLFERREAVARNLFFLKRSRDVSAVVWEVEPEQIRGAAVDTTGELRVSVPGRPDALFSLDDRAEAWREAISSLYDPLHRDN